jgi:Ser-tRNA(Ala) deacylase AlaX
MEEKMNEQEGKAKFQDLSLAPMHTAEHILNQTMVRMFGCSRSRVNHIEKKKSKCNYTLLACPTEEQVRAIEEAVNAVIAINHLQ